MLATHKRLSARKIPVALSILALFVSGCASTPEPAPAPEPVVEAPAPAPEPAPKVEIKPSAPQEYVVKKGDTLWDISTKFLNDPWYWPEIWHVNPQIANPHLIYPGDVITLFYIDGKPYLGINGGPRVEEIQREKLEPTVRVEPVQRDDDIVPIQTIHQFIVHPRVVDEDTLKKAPYIVDSQDKRLVYGPNERVYVRGIEGDQLARRYSVYRKGTRLLDPQTGEFLGYEAVHVGEARLEHQDGVVSTVMLENTVREALRGDLLMPIEDNYNRTFIPHAPSNTIDGEIISLFDAISQIGQNQVVVLNVGARDGLEKGHVLAVNQAGRTVRDEFARRGDKTITLPEERAGVLMIFRTFDKVSYGLIMEATRAIHLGDTVSNP
jgi:hypothetical protein